MAITLGVSTEVESNNAASVTSGAITTQATASTFVGVDAGQGTVSISDSKANTWVVGASQNFNGTNGITHLWYVQNATGGSGHTFSGAQTGGAGPLLMVGEFIGAVLSGGPNASNFQEVSGSTAAVTGLSVTTTVANCVIVTVMVGSNFPTIVTPTSTNGAVVTSYTTNGINVAGAMSYFIAGAPGSYNDTLTFAGQTFYDFAAYTFAFAPAGGGGGGATQGYVAAPGNPDLSAPSNVFQFLGVNSSIPPPSNGNVTIGLNGQAATFTPGQLGAQLSIGLLGQLAAFTPGTFTPGLSVSMLGQAATFASGSLKPALTLGLAGQSALWRAGQLTPSGGTPVIGPQVTLVGFIANMGSLMGH